MTQEKSPNGKPRRTRKPKVTNDAPLVEQITELMMIHNKSDPKAGVQVVSEIDKDGKVKTVPADEKNENSFLKFDKNSSILENFIKNFWSQLKEPTHFRLLRMTYHDYKVNKQAIRDLSEGKQTDAVKEFLKRYEIRPRENKKEQSVNQKEKTAMADKETQPQEPLQQSEVQQAAQQQQQPQAQQAAQESQGPRYRYNENMVNWEELEKVGISKASLEQQGLLDSMLKGYKTNKLVPLTIHLSGLLTAKLDARLSLIPQQDGQVGLAIHGIRKEPQLERPYFGFNFNEEDKKNLRETGNMGRVAELNLRGSEYTPCLISIDKSTNELVAVRQEHVYIPQEVSGVKLTAEEIRLLKEGQPVKVEGMTSKAGKEFDATLQYSAERRGLEFIFPKNQIFNERSIGGVPLSPTQIKMLSEGHTILVEDMKFRNRNDTFSSFVTIDKVTGRPNYTRHNPETGEIYIPKEICNVQLTAEDRETLRKGQPVYLENMIGRNGEEFSSFVKLDMNTGRTMYSRTPNGFNEQQAPRIPAEVYGHVFTAQEKANLQDGKTLLVEGLKNNGQTFSSYLKVNPYSGQLQYFQENPDIRRDTSRRAADGDRTGTTAGAEEGCIAGSIDLPGEKQNQSYKPKKTNRMNTDQNTRHIYKTEDIDWDGLKAAGISKKQLEAEGNMELLLQGKETGIVPLKLHISVLSLTMDATLKLVPDGNGRPVMEINGLRQKEEAAV